MSGLAIVTKKLQANTALKVVVPLNSIYLISVAQAATAPFVVLNQVGGSDGLHLNGQNEYPLHRVMVECCASTGAAAMNIGELVLTALRNTIKATVGDFVDVDITEAGPDLTDHSDDRTMFRRMLQFHVRFRRS